MNQISRRGAHATLFVATLALSANVAFAQNLFVSAANGSTPQLWTVDPANAAAASAITFPAGTYLPTKASAFDVDQRTGDLFIVRQATPSANIEILRTVVDTAATPPIVTSQTSILTIPNTGGYVPQYLYREATGGYLLLSYSPPPTNGYYDHRIHRLGLTSNSGIAVEVPFNDINQVRHLSDICSSISGTIYLTGPKSGSQVSSIWSVPATGGTPTITSLGSWNQTTFHSIETDAGTGTLMGGTSLFPAPSLICPTGTSNVYNAAVDLYRQLNGDFLLVDNVPGGSDIREFGPGTCGGMTGGVILWAAPSALVLFKVARAQLPPNKLYGSPCAIGASTLPLLTETSEPIIDTDWVLDLTGASPFTNSSLYIGFNELTPLPITATCTAFQTADQVVTGIVTDGVGAATFTQATPNDVSTIGFRFYPQWAIFDNTAPGGVAVTAALATMIDLPTSM